MGSKRLSIFKLSASCSISFLFNLREVVNFSQGNKLEKQREGAGKL